MRGSTKKSPEVVTFLWGPEAPRREACEGCVMKSVKPNGSAESVKPSEHELTTSNDPFPQGDGEMAANGLGSLVRRVSTPPGAKLKSRRRAPDTGQEAAERRRSHSELYRRIRRIEPADRAADHDHLR